MGKSFEIKILKIELHVATETFISRSTLRKIFKNYLKLSFFHIRLTFMPFSVKSERSIPQYPHLQNFKLIGQKYKFHRLTFLEVESILLNCLRRPFSGALHIPLLIYKQQICSWRAKTPPQASMGPEYPTFTGLTGDKPLSEYESMSLHIAYILSF